MRPSNLTDRSKGAGRLKQPGGGEDHAIFVPLLLRSAIRDQQFAALPDESTPSMVLTRLGPSAGFSRYASRCSTCSTLSGSRTERTNPLQWGRDGDFIQTPPDATRHEATFVSTTMGICIEIFRLPRASAQQIRGICSPQSRSRIRSPPNRLRIAEREEVAGQGGDVPGGQGVSARGAELGAAEAAGCPAKARAKVITSRICRSVSVCPQAGIMTDFPMDPPPWETA